MCLSVHLSVCSSKTKCVCLCVSLSVCPSETTLFTLTLRSEVTNDAAVIVYHTQMLSDIPLTVCLSMCLSVCLSICSSVCLSVCPSRLTVCLSVCLSICSSVCLHVCLSVCPSVHLSVCLFDKSKIVSVCLCVCLSVCLSTCSSVCLSVYLSLSLSVNLSIRPSISSNDICMFASSVCPLYNYIPHSPEHMVLDHSLRPHAKTGIDFHQLSAPPTSNAFSTFLQPYRIFPRNQSKGSTETLDKRLKRESRLCIKL